MKAVAVAIKGKGLNLSCGLEGCDSDHETYDVKDVILISEELTYDNLPVDLAGRQEQATSLGVLYPGKTGVYPTMLGMWWEGVSDN